MGALAPGSPLAMLVAVTNLYCNKLYWLGLCTLWQYFTKPHGFFDDLWHLFIPVILIISLFQQWNCEQRRARPRSSWLPSGKFQFGCYPVHIVEKYVLYMWYVPAVCWIWISVYAKYRNRTLRRQWLIR